MTWTLAIWLAACTPSDAGAPAPRVRTLTLAAYTTPREAYGRAILPAFAEHWKQRTGEVVTFQDSYQGSGAQARAVIAGLEADVVALSLEPDVERLVEAGLITHDWRGKAHGGMVSTSLAVIAVRPGNPLGLSDWPDLARPDVEVLTPNVRTSGGAMWNVLAVWGAAKLGRAGALPGDNDAPERLLSDVLSRVTVMDKGARESIMTFEKGVGDAAITYENEVLVAQADGRPIAYVVPPATVRIDNPVAVVDVYATRHGNQDLAAAFVDFLGTPEVQVLFAQHGLRPVLGPAPSGLPQPELVFTVQDLGGWSGVTPTVFAEGGVYDRALDRAQGGRR